MILITSILLVNPSLSVFEGGEGLNYWGCVEKGLGLVLLYSRNYRFEFSGNGMIILFNIPVKIQWSTPLLVSNNKGNFIVFLKNRFFHFYPIPYLSLLHNLLITFKENPMNPILKIIRISPSVCVHLNRF